METSGDLLKLKFSAAVQITRPKSASHQGFSPSPNSPKQMKVAQLVLKKSIEQSPIRSPPTRSCRINNNPSTDDTVNINNIVTTTRDDDHKVNNLLDHLSSMKSESMSFRAQVNVLKDDTSAKPPLNKKPVKIAVNESSHNHKSSNMDEVARKEAREFMKKQKEKRKLETKKEEDDKSQIIKQRLEQLKITTKNVIANKPTPLLPHQQKKKVNGNSHDYLSDSKLRRIHTLKLKPNIQSLQMGKPHDNNNINNNNNNTQKQNDEKQDTMMTMMTKEKESEMEVNQFPASPVKKTQQLKKLVSPLQLQNHQLRLKHDVAQQTTLENVKSIVERNNMKLKIPNVKLNITALSRHDIVPSHFKKKTPSWLESSFTYPYPYNFIFAVKKKLEAYVSANEQSRKTTKKQPQKKKTKKVVDDVEDMNTMSEISSIQSDLVLMKSTEDDVKKKENKNIKKKVVGGNNENVNIVSDDDDTTISISTLNSVKNDVFIGKKRESVNSEFDKNDSLPIKNDEDLKLEDVSPNTSEKRENFLSSTKIEDTFKKPDLKPTSSTILQQEEQQNNNIKNENDNRNTETHDHEKENDYRKMLNAFHQSLSQVIEVNNKLSSVINSQSPSIKSSTTTTSSSTAKSYSTLFEKPIESDSSNIQQQESSSIQTFIESDGTLKEKVDPPLIINENYKDYKNNESTSDDKQLDTTLNDSKILNILKLNSSFNENFENLQNYESVFNKSTKEIHSWEKKLIDRMKGEIAWLEWNKQNLKKNGNFEKAALMRNLQRTLLLRLEKEREKLRNASNSIDIAATEIFNDESVTKNEIERILEKRENKLNLKRKQIERLIKWQQKLDQEEEKLKKIEQQLLGKNSAKLSSSKVSNENDLNISIEKVKSIDQSLEILRNIPSHEDHPEVIIVSGLKLNKLWKRLTGNSETKFNSNENFSYNKEKFSQLYEEARQFVLQSNFEEVLEISHIHANIVKDEDAKSEVSTMNSIANIETEEEYPGSYQIESEVTSTTTKSTETSLPKFENLTFEVPRVISPEQIVKIPNLNTSIGIAEMDVDKDNTNNYSTSSFEKIDSSSVDKDGSIIPEIINSTNSNQITDMDESYEQQEDQLIEDISFPDYETSLSIRESDENNRNNLSTITECTEYEQSPGSSEIYTDIGTATSSTTTSTSESKNIEIQNRLISINESLSEVNEAFDRVVKPLSLSKAHSSDTSSKTSENTIQFSQHDVTDSTKNHEKYETNVGSSSSSCSSSTSDF